MIYSHKSSSDLVLDLKPFTDRHSGDKTVVYKSIFNQQLLLSYYLPLNFNPQNSYPALVLIHGGGWNSKKVFDDQATWSGDHLGFLARYFADKGCVAVSVDYRLASQNAQLVGCQLTDLYEDCLDAYYTVVKNAEEYGIDIKRIAVLGESAGGYLAGALATFGDVTPFSAVLVNSITDLTGKYGWDSYTPLDSNHPKLKLLSIAERARRLSPVYNVSKNTCPTILLHGEEDIAVDIGHSQLFYDAMKSVDRPCVFHRIEKTNHAFLLAEYTKYISACKLSITIIEDELRKIGFFK